MWISRKKYETLISEKASFVDRTRSQETLLRNYCQRNMGLLTENKNLREQLEQLKTKYVDEVRKNFELANYLSETKNDSNRDFMR